MGLPLQRSDGRCAELEAGADHTRSGQAKTGTRRRVEAPLMWRALYHRAALSRRSYKFKTSGGHVQWLTLDSSQYPHTTLSSRWSSDAGLRNTDLNRSGWGNTRIFLPAAKLRFRWVASCPSTTNNSSIR